MNHPFIVFEGVDGAGKSEISAIVSKKMNAMHLESPIGEFKKIRQYVDLNLNDKARFLFYLASNFDLSDHIRENRLSNTIICARYFHSTIIGYASRQGLNIEDFYKNSPVALDDFEKPDLTIFLYVNEAVQQARIKSRQPHDNSLMDYKCLDDEDYREILFNNYCFVATKESWIYVDTSFMSIDQVVDVCIERIFTK